MDNSLYLFNGCNSDYFDVFNVKHFHHMKMCFEKQAKGIRVTCSTNAVGEVICDLIVVVFFIGK